MYEDLINKSKSIIDAYTSMQNLTEASLGRIYQHTKNRNLGIITAFRNEYTLDENKKRNQELIKKIRDAGYGFNKIKGRFIENYGTDLARPVDEESILVFGKDGNDNDQLLNDLKNLGTEYEQESILHKAYDSDVAKLHGTKDPGFPGLNQTFELGTWHPDKVGEFHSVLRDPKTGNSSLNGTKRTFTFESVDIVSPASFSSRQEYSIVTITNK
jgi:hypothetical protein